MGFLCCGSDPNPPSDRGPALSAAGDDPAASGSRTASTPGSGSRRRGTFALACVNCETPVGGGRPYCPECGLSVCARTEDEMRCRTCSSLVHGRFCYHCGNPTPLHRKIHSNHIISEDAAAGAGPDGGGSDSFDLGRYTTTGDSRHFATADGRSSPSSPSHRMRQRHHRRRGGSSPSSSSSSGSSNSSRRCGSSSSYASRGITTMFEVGGDDPLLLTESLPDIFIGTHWNISPNELSYSSDDALVRTCEVFLNSVPIC